MQASRHATVANEKRPLLVRLARVIFRPAVQLLLRHGISGLEIEEIVRWCCVDVALNEPEFAIPGRNVHSQTQSHAAILTGFTRSEVKRLAKHAEPEVDAVTERASRIERVIEVWRTDEAFHDEHGRPRALPLRGPAPSLETIVRREGRDTPVRAIADALVVAGNADWEGKKLKLKLERQTFTGLSHSPENVRLRATSCTPSRSVSSRTSSRSHVCVRLSTGTSMQTSWMSRAQRSIRR